MKLASYLKLYIATENATIQLSGKNRDFRVCEFFEEIPIAINCALPTFCKELEYVGFEFDKENETLTIKFEGIPYNSNEMRDFYAVFSKKGIGFNSIEFHKIRPFVLFLAKKIINKYLLKKMRTNKKKKAEELRKIKEFGQSIALTYVSQEMPDEARIHLKNFIRAIDEAQLPLTKYLKQVETGIEYSPERALALIASKDVKIALLNDPETKKMLLQRIQMTFATFLDGTRSMATYIRSIQNTILDMSEQTVAKIFDESENEGGE